MRPFVRAESEAETGGKKADDGGTSAMEEVEEKGKGGCVGMEDDEE